MSEQRDRVYLQDILESVEAVEDYVADQEFQDFQRDRKTVSATIREFQIIGEAIGNLSEELKNRHSTVLWQDIRDFRNKLVHEYFGVDLEIVWNTIHGDLPELKNQVEGILHLR